MKLIVQRKVEVWVEDYYRVDEINEEIINKAVDYELDSYDSETLWDTLEDLGPVEVCDDCRNILYSNIR